MVLNWISNKPLTMFFVQKILLCMKYFYMRRLKNVFTRLLKYSLQIRMFNIICITLLKMFSPFITLSVKIKLFALAICMIFNNIGILGI